MTLAELHFVLNEAMGWSCSHSHSFTFGKRTFGDPELDPHNELKYENEREATLQSLADAGDSFEYLYDFGDGWQHEVTIEKGVPADEQTAYPLCIGGAHACPPEDCHGPHGYAEFLRAIQDPKHAEHHEMLTWIGGFFDPAGFDPNRTNLAIRQMYECPDCEGCDNESCDCEHDGQGHGHNHEPN